MPPTPEGVLTLRARPPSEGEFVDCFQKIKLAINLLVSPAAPALAQRLCEGRVEALPRPLLTGSCPQAKLQKHIQNPSAAELVHFLFGPLDLVPGAGQQGRAGWEPRGLWSIYLPGVGVGAAGARFGQPGSHCVATLPGVQSPFPRASLWSHGGAGPGSVGLSPF